MDVKFSMPFNASGEPTTTGEDLQDLFEFEKSNPDQTRVANERTASDNSPQSMLCFEGSSDVHRFYDFLLNHRSLLNSTAAMDVPVLYAPTAFDNASLSVLEITCKQLKRSDGCIQPQIRDDKVKVSRNSSETASDTTYIMETKGSFLPPWVILRLCTVVQESQPLGFSARFVTEPLTMGLNIAQGEITHNANAASFKSFFSKSNGVTNCDTISKTKTEFFPTSECDHSSGLGTAVVKELRYKDNSYKVSLAPLQLATSL
ncbi:uncharacterized protein [Physcomitrium patens]|uniref:uncharacterized protein isoform X2 n=1 Tax=Physcomitrium patens TaxID=3218 RepID=UPI003CCCD352